MKPFLSYSAGTLFSIALHAVVIAALFFTWTPERRHIEVQPQYIVAELVELTPKMKEEVKPKPQAPKVDTEKIKVEQERKAAEQKRQAEQKRKAEQQRRDELARKEREKQDKLRREKEDKEKRQKEEAARKAEAERKRIESEFAETMKQEQLALAAETDTQLKAGYLQIIQRRLSQSWSRPPSARLGMEAIVTIGLLPTGRVSSVAIRRSSGDAAFDRSAQQAVYKAEPFTELQQLYKESPSLFEREFRSLDVAFSPEDLRM